MKILHISDVFVRHGGGAPNVIRALSLEQIKKGHEVGVITFKQTPDLPDYEEIDGITVYQTLQKDNWLPFYISGLRNMQKLARNVLSDFQPDLIHVHMPFAGWAVLSEVQNQIPVVYTFHGGWADEYLVEAQGLKRKSGLYLLEFKLMQWFEKQVLKRADKIITLSKFMQESAQKYNLEPKLGWQVIPSGVDLEAYIPRDVSFRNEFRQRKKIPHDSFYILTVRRLAQRMGLEELIQSIEHVRNTIPNVLLIIGGKGDLESKLGEEIRDRRLESFVRMEGFIANDELPDYMAAADVFVLPTQALEGFGLVTLESMACGTPVLGTPSGAIPEVLKPLDSKLLLDGIDYMSIAKGIMDYYQNYKDQSEELRIKVRSYAQNFGWKNMADRYEEVYRTVMSK